MKIWSGWLFTRVRSHVNSFSFTCLTVKSRKIVVPFRRSLVSSLDCACCLPLCMCAQVKTSLGVSLMALRYICLFSTRPSINDPAKRSFHRSQAALIYHYSALIGRISTSLPMRQAGGEMSRDKQPNSKWRGRRGRGGARSRGGWGRLEENREIKIQEGWERWKSGEMQIIYLENSGCFSSLCLVRK